MPLLWTSFCQLNIISVDISLIKYRDLFEIEIRSLNSVAVGLCQSYYLNVNTALLKSPGQAGFNL